MIEIHKITDVLLHLDGLKAIVFDLDDTLYGEREYVKSGYFAVSQMFPQIKNAEAKLWQAFEKKKSAIDELLLSEGIYSDELKQKCLEVYRYHQPTIHLYDGVVEMLTLLRKQGLLLGIITDGRPEGQWAKITTLKLTEYVDQIIVTDELGGVEYRKPNKKAFMLLKELFDVQFSEMCYVGDNIKKDFIPCEQLDIKPVYFVNKDGLYFDFSYSNKD